MDARPGPPLKVPLAEKYPDEVTEMEDEPVGALRWSGTSGWV